MLIIRKPEQLLPRSASIAVLFFVACAITATLTLIVSGSIVLAQQKGATVTSNTTTSKSTTTQTHHHTKTRRRHHHRKQTDVKHLPSHTGRHMPPPGTNGEEVNREWYRLRALPNEFIDPAQYPRALADARVIPVWRSAGKYGTASTQQWQFIGPTSIGGRVSAIAVDPFDSNTFYAGAANGGVWKTSDHGTSWLPLTDTFAAAATGAITVDPTDPKTIYLGQGECDFSGDSYPGNGLWKSIDGGATWTSIGLTKTQYIAKILIDPTDHNILYVASPGGGATSDSNRGVFKSIDGGQTWTRSLNRIAPGKGTTPLPIVDLAMNPLNHNELAAFALDQRSNGSHSYGGIYTGLWHSNDAGVTWKRIDTSAAGFPNGVKLQYLSRGSLAWVDSSGTAILYAGLSIAGVNAVTNYRADVNFYGLYRSTSPESSWQKLQDTSLHIPYGFIAPDSTDILYRQGDYNFYLATNPLHHNELYIGGIDVLRSTDYGRTFQDITRAYPAYFHNDRSQHSDQHALVFTASKSGNDLLLGSDGGVFSTRDFGTSWTQYKGLPITMFYKIECWWPALDHLTGPIQPSDLKLFGGTQDNGTVEHGLDTVTDWRWINRGDGGVAVAHPTDSGKLFTSQQLGGLSYRVSLDSLGANPASDLFGTNPANFSNKWHLFSAQLLKGASKLTDSTEACAFIAPMVIDPLTGADIYTAREHVYHAKFDYANHTLNWSLWSPTIGGALGNPKQWYNGDIECMATGPRDASGRPMLWAGGYLLGSSSYLASLWRTTVNLSRSLDSAPTWLRVTTGLPGNSVSAILPDRSDSMTAFCSFVGSGGGHVYKTIDGGKTWKNISGNLPSISVSAILIDTVAEHGDTSLKNYCLFAATDVGVFVTTNGGAFWYRLGSGMPTAIIHDIKQYKNWLVAATDGRSAWAVDVSDLRAAPQGVEVSSPISTSQSGFASVWPDPIKNSQRTVHFKLNPIVLEGTATGSHVVSVDLVEIASGISRSLFRSSHVPENAIESELPLGLTSGAYALRLTVDGVPFGVRQLRILK